MTDPTVHPLPEAADAPLGQRPLVLRGEAADWPLAALVDSGGWPARFWDAEVTASRKGHPDQTMTFAESVELDGPWYLCWNVHGQRGELVGDLPPELESWFEWLPAAVRPAWTWMFVGPSGTGTALHLDTMGSSAWNALLSGGKEWRILSPERSTRAGLLDPAVAGEHPAVGDFEYRCTQRPGDLIVVPGGWAHEVVNVGDTVSITGNFVNASNIHTVETTLAAAKNEPWLQVARRVRAAGARRGSAAPA